MEYLCDNEMLSCVPFEALDFQLGELSRKRSHNDKNEHKDRVVALI